MGALRRTLKHNTERTTMDWPKLITIVAALALVAAVAQATFSIIDRPEPLEAIPAQWTQSGHSDRTSLSFTYWDDDDPPVIPEGCAKCHGLYGYLDYLGLDDRTPGQVDEPSPVGSVIYCYACHSEPAHELTSVVFPGDTEVTGLKWTEANCMNCHSGRASTVGVNEAIEGLEADTVDEELEFINVHYGVAAATLMGAEVAVGYQYADREYVGRYAHAPDYARCTDCHDAHSLKINPRDCAPCHANVVDYDDIYDIRELPTDHDGDGNTQKGILAEIEALHTALYAAIHYYAAEVVEDPILYGDAFPYFFFKEIDAEEQDLTFPNRYLSWTPRLLRAAYNYHYVHQDPGAFSHNPEYVLQLLYDALDDLSEKAPVDMERYTRP